MDIPLLNLVGQYNSIKDELDQAISGVLNSGTYIMGPQVAEFETDLALHLRVKHVISVASGSDALLISLDALGIGPGDKVIVPTFTFFATAGAVSRLGAIPVFVDINKDDYNLNLDHVEEAINNNSNIKAVIPVHIFGLPCNMESLMSLAEKYELKVVEDACQAINADIYLKNSSIKKAGTIGHTGCFSFFPSKNLSCFGDGGAIVTNSDAIAEKVRILRVHGSKPKYYHKMVGYNSRLDTLQAAVLNVKLRYLNSWTKKRQIIAAMYNDAFKEANLGELVKCPKLVNGHVFHQYVVEAEKRDELIAFLNHKSIGTSIYYPLPLHLQECFQGLGYREGSLPVAERTCKRVLALPIDPELTSNHILYIVKQIASFYKI
ncbi:MAG: DegT/DnrJ/EryC1/StrS family aminotransferase [Syntrophomonas sp.]